MRIPGPHSDSTNNKFLSPVAVWALSFGCAVGWGSFVMPGTTFLPIAGPLGSVLGLIIGAAVMMVIAVNYSHLMNRYPEPGGAYTYADKLLGSDHGFLCGWMLLLTYAAIIWANAAALPLIMRYLLGNVFCFGFSYEIAGYTVYFGEFLLSMAALLISTLVCVLSRRLTKWVQTVCAVLLFVGISVVFTFIVVRRGGLALPEPLFARKGSPAVQILGIVMLASWAFIGFESVSHSADRFRFSMKRVLPVLGVSLLTGLLAYVMLTVCAGASQPSGYADWESYTGALSGIGGVNGVPTFFNARETMGEIGLVILAAAAFCGIVTGIIGNSVALSNLMQSMSRDGMLPPRIAKQNKQGIPYVALIAIAAVSCLMPLLGRTAIGWIVNVTTVGAAVVYAYTSVCAYKIGKEEKKLSARICGIAGAVFTTLFALFCLIPNLLTQLNIDNESYLILVFWCVLGMVVFRLLIGRDKTRRLGKSEIVWIILFILILIVSLSWIRLMDARESSTIADDITAFHSRQAETAGLSYDNQTVQEMNEYISHRITQLNHLTMRNISIYSALMLSAVVVVFSIFSIIKKRERAIEAQRLRAEEMSRAKTIFLSNMSHDIRTPMNAITGYTALALDADDLPGDVRDYLEKIDYSGKHLLALINDILDMSRIESGKVELEYAPADLYEIMDRLIDLFSLQFEAKKIHCKLDYSSVEDRYVICDKHRLDCVLLNLVSNAYKFTPPGGSITVSLRQLGSDLGKGSYELSVADTGIGMSEEFQKHLFNAFERERTSTVSRVQGTGLGMAITKSLIELMEGTITVHSVQNEGTTFTIHVQFPITRRENYELTQQHFDAHSCEIKDKRLLIAEDNPINFEIAREMLTRMGFEVDGAENGREAVEKIASQPPTHYCAVLMDVQMPVMNGYEATRAIRAMDDARAHLPIIAMTANSFDSDRKDAFEAGMIAFVSKPFEPEELRQTILQHMR